MTPKDLAAKHYSFLVVSGINPADPLPQRSLRMHLYQKFISDLDSTGEHISAQLSEVDLSDPEDVKATVPSGGTDLLLYFGHETSLRAGAIIRRTLRSGGSSIPTWPRWICATTGKWC